MNLITGVVGQDSVQRVATLSIKHLKKLSKVLEKIKMKELSQAKSSSSNGIELLAYTVPVMYLIIVTVPVGMSTQDQLLCDLHRDSDIYRAKSVWEQTNIISDINRKKLKKISTSSNGAAVKGAIPKAINKSNVTTTSTNKVSESELIGKKRTINGDDNIDEETETNAFEQHENRKRLRLDE